MTEPVEITRAITVMHIEGAQLAMFCPGCGMAHIIAVKRYGPEHPVWDWNGDRDRPTFSPSLLVTWNGSPKRDNDHPKYPHSVDHRRVCHSFVRDGHWEFLGDCTHHLRGQRVPIPPFRWHDEDDAE